MPGLHFNIEGTEGVEGKKYKIQLPVLLFLVVLHQLLHQQISMFSETNFQNFIKPYL